MDAAWKLLIRLFIPILSLAMVCASAASAGAVEAVAAESVDELEKSISRVAPEDSTVRRESHWVRLDEGGAPAPLLNKFGSIQVPGSGSGSVVSRSTGVEVSMPDLRAVKTAKIAKNGMVVYPAAKPGGTSFAISSSESSAAIQIIIPEFVGVARYRFRISGATPVMNADGSVNLISPAKGQTGPQESAQAERVGYVKPPWAVDANGADVPTRYEVDGNSLVQVVDTRGVTAFPVVADPDIIFLAKCGSAISLFLAENSAIAGKFWRVFKSRKALISLFKGLKGMKMSTKMRYITNRLGTTLSKISGLSDLILRCTP